jgi:dTDP-3-amino-2,3,6-trideoxy-4-keto-D-glucose/dTDP-3-amino-3,4,6-trideoxy-alpha-D-glucose/dTDP-2,6-dideoxy-D-kanosamine transaminase
VNAAVTKVLVADPARAALAEREQLSEAIERVLASGRYLLGPEQEAFEAEFAGFLGVPHCVGVASGTDALELALLAVGCSDGDAVLTAANCGGYASAAARSVGLRVRFADVDPQTLALSQQSVEAGLASDVRAVVVTHLYGLLAGVEKIVDLCGERGVAVVEDCAHAPGARRNGRRAGSFGDAAAFSFYPTKNLAALGDAGAVATPREDVAERLRQLRQYGWSAKYEVSLRGGRNSRLDELQAAVLRLRLGSLDHRNEARRRVVGRYAEALSPASGRFIARAGEDCVAHLAVALVEDRPAVRAAFEAAGVATDVHYPTADHRQPAWESDHAGVRLPVTEDAVERVLTIPCFPELRDDEVERICEVLDGL